ncbi:MAG: YncE family protein, partial [bacterium]
MRSLILQIPMSRCLRQSWRRVLAAMLILAILGCTGHNNPFDPKNTKKGDPFELTARTGYGKIHLEWKRPAYPVDGGDPISLDSFRAIRTDPQGKKDTLRLDKQEKFDDAEIVGDMKYQYQVAAVRGRSQSDLSSPAAAFAYPMPLDSSFLGAKPIMPLGILFSITPTAIGFYENVKFVAYQGNLCVVRPDGESDQRGACRFISNRTSDMALVRNAAGDSVHIIACSAQNKEFDFLVWTGGQLSWIRRTGSNVSPQAIAPETIGDSLFVADDEADAIFKISRFSGDLRRTKMQTGLNPWRLVVLPNPPRLFCANKGSKSVSVFDIVIEARLESIGVDEEPVDLWLGPDSMLYVACKTGSSVVIIDPRTRANIGKIQVINPEKTESNLFPMSVTGFADPQNRHQGVVAVVACSGDPSAYPAFLLYYSLADRKLQRYLKLPPTLDPARASFLARMNPEEGRLYLLLYD